MNHSDFVEHVADKSGLTIAVVAQVLNATSTSLQQLVEAGHRVQIAGIGTVDTTVRKQRNGRNPRTGETITIPEHSSVKITPAAALRRAAR